MTRFIQRDKICFVKQFMKNEQERSKLMSNDYSKLAGKIVEKYGTQYNFAQAMGLSERSISLKMNNRVPWKDFEMAKASELLDIDVNQLHEYFFTPKVHVREQIA